MRNDAVFYSASPEALHSRLMLSRIVPSVTLRVTHGAGIVRCVGSRANSGQISTRRDGRAVDGGGLENHCTGNGTGGSNPSPSAKCLSTAGHPRRHVSQPLVSIPAELLNDLDGRRRDQNVPT